jgi:hypothetical protein
MFEFNQRAPQQERIDACLAIVHSYPGWQEMATDSDARMVAELIIHALDETVIHAMDHVKRAHAISWQNPEARSMLQPLLIKLLAEQFDYMMRAGIKQLLAEIAQAVGGKTAPSVDELFEQLGLGKKRPQ